MNYFDVPGLGYIAYVRYLGTSLVLSDPVCPPTEITTVIGAFLCWHRSPFFVQIHEPTAAVLQGAYGFLVNSFGIENAVDPSDFHISWNMRRDLKRWLSALHKRNVTIHRAQDGLDRAEIARVSNEWISTKTVRRELAFLAKPFSLSVESGSRRFFSFMDGRLVAFCTFDPCYWQGAVVGYALNHMRAARDSPNGIIDFTIVDAIRTFESDGIRKVHLGLSPLHERDRTRFRGAALTDLVADFLYRSGSKMYHFKELGFHKDRYRPKKEQVYLASRKSCTLPDIFRLLRVNRVL